MKLDPQSKSLWEMQTQAQQHRIGLDDVRQQRTEFVQVAIALARTPLEVSRCENRLVPGTSCSVPVRLYWPPGSPADRGLAAIVYAHGGGYVVGNLDTHDSMMREICVLTGMVVCAVDYRLSPDHKFPAALEDVCSAVRWLAANAAQTGIDARRIGVAGESAGGNIAAAAALVALDDPSVPIAAQFLVYPHLCALEDFTTPSRRDLGDDGGHIPTRAQIEAVIQHYTSSAADRKNPLVSPLIREDVRGAAPALIMTAGFDPLRDEGKMYADRLQAGGVAVRYQCLETTIHGFMNFGKALDISQFAFESFATHAKELLRP
jgi:acetyl esterase